MKIELQIYNPPRFGLSQKQCLIFVLIIFYSVVILIIKKYILLILTIPLTIYSHLIDKYRPNPNKFLSGRLVISSESITLNEQKFLLNEINDLKIEINEFDGMERTSPDGEDTIFLNGVDNLISFKHNNQSYSLKFYISDIAKYYSFKDLFHEWYSSKVSFFESSNKGCRTYCLEYLNYKEILEFKEKYK